MRYDWGKIETEYVTGRLSMEKLADKYGISHSNFFKKAKERKFAEKRREFREKAEEVARARARRSLERKLERIIRDIVDGVSAGAKTYRETMQDPEMLFKHVVMGKNGLQAVGLDVMNTKAYMNMTSAGNNLVGTVSGLGLLGSMEDQRDENEIRVSIALPERTDGDVD